MEPHADRLADLELARDAAQDPFAFEELYRRHRQNVYRLCLRMLGNASDAEDLTQEIFLQLHRKIATFKGTAALSTWLYRMATNRLLMQLRANRRRLSGYCAKDDEVERASLERGPRTPEVLIDRIDLKRAIRRLPPGYRAVLVLHDAEGYEPDQIARILGIAVGTARSQLHKARLRMRRLLRRRYPFVNLLPGKRLPPTALQYRTFPGARGA